jgi:hypothetical protein
MDGSEPASGWHPAPADELAALRALLARAAESKQWSEARQLLADGLPAAPAGEGSKR